MQLKGSDEVVTIPRPWLRGEGRNGYGGTELDGRKLQAQVHCQPDAMELIENGLRWRFQRQSVFAGIGGVRQQDDHIAAPMPGRIISVQVSAGEQVSEGQTLVVMEAMKMEISLKAPTTGVVASVAVAEGDFVEAGADVVELDSADMAE